MSTTDHSDEDDGRVIAAEYVLGVLNSADRKAVEEHLAREPGFAAEVAFWEERLGPLADGVRPVSPPARIWANIEEAVKPPPEPDAPPVRESLWESLAFWRLFGFGTMLATLASVGALAYVLISAAAAGAARADAGDARHQQRSARLCCSSRVGRA